MDTADEKIRADQLRAKFEPYAKVAASYTIPIVLNDHQGQLEPLGSAVLLQHSLQTFIATAAHVQFQAKKSGKSLVAIVNQTQIQLDLTTAIVIDSASTSIDLCLIPISTTVQGLPLWQFYIGDKIFEGTAQLALGYPITRNQTSTGTAKMEEGKFLWGFFSFMPKFDVELKPIHEAVNHNDHWFYKYTGGFYAPAPDADLLNVGANNLIKLKGMSGSGVWCITNNALRLAGIFIEFENGICVATKSKHLKKLVNQTMESKLK